MKTVGWAVPTNLLLLPSPSSNARPLAAFRSSALHHFFLIIGGSRDTIESRLVCKRDQGARYQCSFRKGKGVGEEYSPSSFFDHYGAADGEIHVDV